MSNIEYRDLLFEISEKLDEDKLPRLVFMCKDEIAKGSERNIRDVLTLFEELEKQNRLGIDRLDTLKQILTQMKEKSLLRKVEKFEIKRKAQSVGIVSSLKRAAACIKGAVKMVCNVRTIAGGLLVVTSGMALRSCTNLDEFVDVFNKVVLVSYSKLVEISEGSLCFTVQADTSSALKELWNIYKSGTLKARLQKFLVTEEIKQLASGEDVEVTVYIDEQEYEEAYLDLTLVENQVSDVKGEKRPTERRRRNSDSFLCITPNEVDVTLMKLKQAENKWNYEWERRHTLEEENEKLKTEITEARNAQRRMFWHEEDSAHETGDLVRPNLRRRRNSDSNLFCKARDEEVEESYNKEPGIFHEGKRKFLDAEREAFVQSYLQSIRAETGSMTTETSDSGVRAQGAPSDFDEMENVTDFSQTYCLKDLSDEVISKLQRALQVDEVARKHIYQSFGIKTRDLRGRLSSSTDIFELFPNTPVKLLKDIFEALQLYDFVDLLSEKTQPFRSLRLALPLQEIEKLRKTADNRPTTYHSSVAVLIIADKKGSNIEELKNFFKGLNLKSEVTIVECENVLRAQHDLVLKKRKWMTSQKKLQKKQEEMQTEIEKINTATSAVIDWWIHNQGGFSLFAVFVFSEWNWESVWTTSVERLVSGIPDKIKYIVGPLPVTLGLKRQTETLLISSIFWFSELFPASLFLEILNKRWQMLDLTATMKELKRTISPYVDLMIQDRLSSLPRFKKEEESTN